MGAIGNMALTAPLSVEGKEGFNMALTAPLSVEGKVRFNMALTAPLSVEGKRAVLAINQCCTVVAPNDTFLVAKCCQLISNLILKQSVKVESRTLYLAVQWSCQALRNCADIAVLDILLALEALLRGNGGKLEEVDSLLGDRGILTSLLEMVDEDVRPNQLAPPEEVRLFCVRCLEALTFPSDEEKLNLEEQYLDTCSQIFLKTLCQQKHLNNDDELSRCKLVISCLRGLENVLVESGALLDVLLGDVLGVVRAFMLYGLPSHSGLVPQPVFPVHLAQTDISQRKNESRGKKVVRLRKNKTPAQKKKNEAIKSKLVDEDPTNSSTSPQFNKFRCFATANYSQSEVHQGYGPSWLRMSDSDYSDTEAGQATRIRETEARVRQAAHSLLLSTIKGAIALPLSHLGIVPFSVSFFTHILRLRARTYREQLATKTAVARVEHIELNVTVYTAGNERKTSTQLLGNSRTTSFQGTTCLKECKEKWKNIRTVFRRHLSSKPPSGSGAQPKKDYYLSDVLQFLVPIIKEGKQQVGNLPSPPRDADNLEDEEVANMERDYEDLSIGGEKQACDKKVLFGYWPSLLPDGPHPPHTRTLITCLLKDPSPKGRMAVSSVLINMLLGSRLYLSQAEDSERNMTAFTPWSVTVGNMVRELHRSLCLAVIAENSLSVLTQLLRCLAALVQNTPYHRLAPGLVTRVVSIVCRFITHKDAKVQVSSLTVLGSVVAFEPSTPEILRIILKPIEPRLCTEDGDHVSLSTSEACGSSSSICEDADGGVMYEDCFPSKSGESSWLMKVCLDNMGVQRTELPTRTMGVSVPIPAQVESLQLLTVLTMNYFVPVVVGQLKAVLAMLDETLVNTDSTVRLHAGRVLEALSSSMRLQYKKQDGTSAVSVDEMLQFWTHVLSGPLVRMLQNPDHAALRAVGCDCLANLEEETFQLLSHDKHILIITILFGCSKDEENYVRSSAIRALAICVLFQVLREDIHFVMDTAEFILQGLGDKSLGVRIKASWSLGNLSDALALNKMNSGNEDIPDFLLLQLLQASISSAKDNDKVRSNAVRAVGNLLRLLEEPTLCDPSFKGAVQDAVDVLVQNSTSGSNMKSGVFNVLGDLVANFRNFKVRINAALALSMPATRQQYGSHFVHVWTALLDGLENSSTMEDFSEYRHHDNLIHQMFPQWQTHSEIFTFTRLHIKLMTQVIFSLLGTILCERRKQAVWVKRVVRRRESELVQWSCMGEYKNSTWPSSRDAPPEKSALLYTAASHCSALLQSAGLNTGEHSSAAMLASVFLLDNTNLIE
uniref:HEAT repeat-containing protein 6 n=1 Tax=Timema monikensis TaxID=170555 RepID=A0A7R9E5V3_9NEOP|nr:unnamed protein product [Timema monikensis]